MLVVCSPSARRHLVWPLAESIMTLRMGTHDSAPFPVMGFISSFREFESLASHSFCHVFKGAYHWSECGNACLYLLDRCYEIAHRHFIRAAYLLMCSDI